MTFGMQLRRWYRSASPAARLRTSFGIIVACLLLAASVVTTGRGAGQQSVTAGTARQGVLAPATTTPGSPGAVSAAAAATSAGAPPGAATPGAIVPTSLVTTAAADEAASDAAPLSASDRGVTADALRIGFLPINLAGLGAAGFAVDLRTDTDKYVRALVDTVNASGGVAGRKIDAVIRPTDPTSQSDQAAACRAMIDDAGVFGVIDGGALSDTPAFDCIAVQHQTPYVHNTIWDTTWLARSGGMEVGYPAAIDRISVTWARDLHDMGWLGDHAVVGILGENCAATSPVIDHVLAPTFAAVPGVQKVIVLKSDCSRDGVVAQPPSFVPQFRAAGVTHVVLATSFVSVTTFLNAAEAQLYRPHYTVSDWWQLTTESAAALFNPNQFDGAIAISSFGLMLPESGKPPYPGGEWCQKVAADAGLEPLEYTGRNQELWAMCDQLLLFLDGVRGAGTNPTRSSWATAIQNLGEHPSILYGPSRFAPGKVTGSDQVHTLQWQAACKCYKSISDFRPAAD